MHEPQGSQRPVSRRTFIAAGAAGVGFVLFATGPGGTRVALAQIPGGTLPPADVPKFQTPLLIPPVMPRAGTTKVRGGKTDRRLRDLDAAVRPADPAGRPPADDRSGATEP